MSERDEDSFRSIADALSAQGYAVSDDVVSADLAVALADVARSGRAEGRMTPARTGKAKTENTALRGDSILWLDEPASEPAVQDCFIVLHELRQALNRQLFLNLHELESHLAIYPPGSIYQKHLDQFATGEQSRQLSMVLYLNRDWGPDDGGELRLYLDDVHDGHAQHVDFSPIGGRLVLFLSSQFWHEVLPASRERVSLTGWFRTRPPV